MRKFTSIFSALVLVAGLLVVTPPAPVAASSIGACKDLTAQTFQSGETKSGFPIRGVYAEVYIGGPAGPCDPDDNMGINAAAVQIGLTNEIGGGFVTLGLTQCNTGDSSWPASLCDGKNRLYAERHGSTFWDYEMHSLGTVTSGTVYSLQISYGCSAYPDRYCLYIDGLLKIGIDMGTALRPTDENVTASWQVETKDRGDGLGNNVSGKSSGVGNIQYQRQDDRLWWLKSVGLGCDTVSGQHQCVKNGSYGFYAYTLN